MKKICLSRLASKHVSLLLRLKFFNAVVAPAMLFNLYTMALTKVQLENIDVLQRKMLRSIVGRARVNGEDWSETMRLMNHSLNEVLEFFAIAPWTQQLAKHQFQFAAKVALEQSWSSMVGHWNFTSHCITDGLRRPKFSKMRANSSFHILWPLRPMLPPCRFGTVIAFHFDSGGRRAKRKTCNIFQSIEVNETCSPVSAKENDNR